MLINKKDKDLQTRSDMPNYNWIDDNWYLVEDDSPLAHKIEKMFPRFDFVLDEKGELIDVVEIPKTPKEINEERVEEIKIELETLDETVDRQWEDYYIRENVTPVDRIAIVINQKKELREELKTLILR